MLDGYGIAMSTRSTVVESLVEAAAPAIEDVLGALLAHVLVCFCGVFCSRLVVPRSASRTIAVLRQLAQDLALALRERGFVPTTTLVRTGLGVLLLLKVRHYPMAAYLLRTDATNIP